MHTHLTMNSLSAQPRTIIGKSSVPLKEEGLLPAVVYGPKQEALSITLNLLELEAFLRHGGESMLVELTGLGKPMAVQIQQLDRDPVTHTPRHVDLYAVEKGAKVTMTIPLSFVGESLAVKLGANVVKVLHEVEIEAAQDSIPHEIEVDLTQLAEINDQIRISDLVPPAGVVFITDAEEVIALAQAQSDEEEEAPVLDMNAIEVEQKGKGEEKEEGAE